jgi:hypothetical protein
LIFERSILIGLFVPVDELPPPMHENSKSYIEIQSTHSPETGIVPLLEKFSLSSADVTRYRLTSIGSFPIDGFRHS